MHRLIRGLLIGSVAGGMALVVVTQGVEGQTPSQAVTFDRFHNYEAQVEILQQLSNVYPKLMSLESYGKSYQGRELWITSVTNAATGPISDKPAFWIDAAFDGGETYTSEIALYFLNYLLTRYGSDPEVTDILDTRGFYIVVNGNPDAGEQLYQKPTPGTKAGPYMGVSRNAWLEPVDDDFDGLLDEDPPEDLDGDGLILQMRVRDPHGHYVTDERDPRLMRVRKPWEKGEWTLYPTEGIDNDGDGRINEDWYGGYDTNRGMPADWDPQLIMEEVAPYPLYAREARHFVDAVLARPNVFAFLALHTTGVFPGGSLWEAPSGRPPSAFPDYDMKVLYPMLGREYERIMRKAPHSRATAMPSYTAYKDRGRTITATTKDFGYTILGILSWTQENNIREPDYNDDGQLTEDERMRWNDTELKEKIFVPWKPFKHPQLGDIEIGGWKRNNDAHGYAPAETISFHAERIIPWYLAVARTAPLVRVLDTAVKSVGPDLYVVSADVRNIGVLDTNVTEHGLSVRLNGPSSVRASVEGNGVEVLMGENPIDLGHLKGNQPGMGRFLGGSERFGETRRIQWLIRSNAGPAKVIVSAGSNKAGTHRVEVPLGPEATSSQ
jgi:hypothetical protein